MRERGWIALWAALALVAVAAGLFASAAAAKSAFKKQKAPIAGGRLFDLGAADYNGDGIQGMFTANHIFLGTLSEFSGGSWHNDLPASGISPTPAFPGFEDLLNPPPITRPGLYIYATAHTPNQAGEVTNDAYLHIVAKGLSPTPLSNYGTHLHLRLNSPQIRVTRSNAARVEASQDGSASPPRTIVDIDMARNSRVDFIAKKLALPPIEVNVPKTPFNTKVYVGARKVPAHSRSFSLDLRDRHGFAWGDINGDGTDDLYIADGGVGGQIVHAYKGQVDDELLLSGQGRQLHDETDGSGLKKGACRGRQAALPDFNTDGRLDIFSSCLDAGPKLWKQDPSGHFQSVSHDLRAAGARGDVYRWADVEPDRGLELLVAQRRRVTVFDYKHRHFIRSQSVRTRNSGGVVKSLALGDFDGDGDPDLFAASPNGNTLIVNRDGRLRARNPRRLGLPSRSLFATFVDADNDGNLDLHALPNGLYASRHRGRRFVPTGELGMSPKTHWAVASWWDFDSDGRRDVAVAGRVGSGPYVRSRFLRNRQRAGHWLQVDVTGPGGAAGSLGAKVRLTIGHRHRHLTGWVGESESSRFGSGDYRVFFGLGGHRRVRRIRVHWPDGTVRQIGHTHANRRITISRGA